MTNKEFFQDILHLKANHIGPLTDEKNTGYFI